MINNETLFQSIHDLVTPMYYDDDNNSNFSLVIQFTKTLVNIHNYR